MEKWDQFWEDVVTTIEEQFGRGNPKEWEESDIEDFLMHLNEVVNLRLEEDELLKEAYEKNAWAPISAITFRNIFQYKKSKGNKTTRNGFAIYMGYQSAADYLAVKKSSSGKPAVNHRTKRFKAAKDKEPIPVTVQLPNANFEKEDKNNHWMLYEVAFLWHGKEPPSIQAHFYQMTREMEQTKANLHKAVELGLLEAETKVFPNGITRFLTRDGLVKYVHEQKLELPEFLNVMLRA
ncbi:MAG: hypothetical protein RLN81_03075 [Balneolaceae bacterium]